MALIYQDVNVLKRGGTTPSLEADDDGMLDETADDSPQPTFWPFENNNSGFSPNNTASNGQTASWAEEMDLRDPPVRRHPYIGRTVFLSESSLLQAAPMNP